MICSFFLMTGLMTEKVTQVFAVFYILLNLLKIRHFAIYEYDNMTKLNTNHVTSLV